MCGPPMCIPKGNPWGAMCGGMPGGRPGGIGGIGGIGGMFPGGISMGGSGGIPL